MYRLRTRQSLVLFSLGVAVFAAILPGASAFFTAVLVPLWTVVPAAVVVLLRRQAVRLQEQPVSLLSILASRGPPS